MQPCALVNQFRVRQMVADVGVVAWDKGDVGSTALGVVQLPSPKGSAPLLRKGLGAAYGIVQCLAPFAHANGAERSERIGQHRDAAPNSTKRSQETPHKR